MVGGGVRLSRDGAVVSPHTSIRPCRCGPLLQLCHGPLLRHTGLIVALRILTVGLDVGQRRGGHPGIQTPLISSSPPPAELGSILARGQEPPVAAARHRHCLPQHPGFGCLAAGTG